MAKAKPITEVPGPQGPPAGSPPPGTNPNPPRVGPEPREWLGGVVV